MATLLLSVDITCAQCRSNQHRAAQHNINYYRVLQSGLERFASLPLPAKDKQAECGHGQIEWRRMRSQKRHRLCERSVTAQHTRVGGQHPGACTAKLFSDIILHHSRASKDASIQKQVCLFTSAQQHRFCAQILHACLEGRHHRRRTPQTRTRHIRCRIPKHGRGAAFTILDGITLK